MFVCEKVCPKRQEKLVNHERTEFNSGGVDYHWFIDHEKANGY